MFAKSYRYIYFFIINLVFKFKYSSYSTFNKYKAFLTEKLKIVNQKSGFWAKLILNEIWCTFDYNICKLISDIALNKKFIICIHLYLYMLKSVLFNIWVKIFSYALCSCLESVKKIKAFNHACNKYRQLCPCDCQLLIIRSTSNARSRSQIRYAWENLRSTTTCSQRFESRIRRN